MMRLLFPFSLALLLAASAASAAQPNGASRCRVDRSQYAALKHGMSYGHVRHLLGCSGRRISHLSIGRAERTTYSWRGRGTYGANLTLTFRDDRLTDKSQLGLSETE
ncbi:DUF3862 domain-containing protein [Methylobacterium brachiatum]|uniref:DUF3862 domain-containing protein n=1 Tax=Methylobacterium brachiatum TaxID=269660 RepID=UPI00244C9A22|nr:DUF3862 domain-containing protein [Methylobacterium brachiatum]MDH2312671.1 DUF3862 domain-containing protein [Methylobacterium brachiatum]